ncbi:MAG: hypothetical protein ASARMPRED_003137 [Alectoria sarmentosa]|nr:MAG: hypothetical protein ASARMPRED_003137 [Alectoria sarmentosa]
MSQQLILDISGATARSKGQARRRNQPALSEDARKAQRNLARRERAKCKKTNNTEQQLRPSVIPSPYADQPQYGAPFSAKGKAAHTPSETPLLPHLPAFTVLPAHANDVNQRALAQSRRHMATQTKAQVTKDIVRDDVQRVGDVNITPEKHRSEARVIAEEQDLNVAGILVDVFKEQHAISTAPAFGNISGNAGVETKASANRKYSRKCPVTTCEYHRKEFLVKVEGDKHIMSHFEGDIKCGCYKCRVFGRKVFNDLEQLRSHNSRLQGGLERVQYLPAVIIRETFLRSIKGSSIHFNTIQDRWPALGVTTPLGVANRKFATEQRDSEATLNGKELLEHFDSCVTLRVESGVHGGRIW